MAIDSTKLGQAAAELMELIEELHSEAELVDVLIIAEIEDDDGTHYRWRGSSNRRSVDTGIAAQALTGLTEGFTES
jgi:hypothetical protein